METRVDGAVFKMFLRLLPRPSVLGRSGRPTLSVHPTSPLRAAALTSPMVCSTMSEVGGIASAFVVRDTGSGVERACRPVPQALADDPLQMRARAWPNWRTSRHLLRGEIGYLVSEHLDADAAGGDDAMAWRAAARNISTVWPPHRWAAAFVPGALRYGC